MVTGWVSISVRIPAFIGGFGSPSVSFAPFTIGFEPLMAHSHEGAESAGKQVGPGLEQVLGVTTEGVFTVRLSFI